MHEPFDLRNYVFAFKVPLFITPSINSYDAFQFYIQKLAALILIFQFYNIITSYVGLKDSIFNIQIDFQAEID
jgi:hypothetical protein